MTYPHWRPTDVVVVFAAATACIGVYRSRLADAPTSREARYTRIADQRIPPTTLDSAQAQVLRRDLFGIQAIENSPDARPQVASGAPIPLPPGVMVSIIEVHAIAGPPWIAVMSGLPGHVNQAVVIPGDTAGSYMVRSISRDTVVLLVHDSLRRFSITRAGN